MIAIFSQQDFETSTEAVIDWLQLNNVPFKRINGVDFFDTVNFELNSEGIVTEGFYGIKVCWFRRWDSFNDLLAVHFSDFSAWNFHELKSHLSNEQNIIRKMLFKSLEDKKWLTHPKEIAYTKLDLLESAAKFGLIIPKTILTSSKAVLSNFMLKNGEIITKIISQSIPRYQFKEVGYSFATQLITKKELVDIPETFSPSLFQIYIEKKYEIRVFFLKKSILLNGNFFAKE
jgi:hypothetical protein